MSDNILAAIIGAVSGSVVAAIGSFFTPWVNWGIEKRRNRIKHQREMITWARAKFCGKMSRKDIRESSDYAAIAAHLSPDLVENIQKNNISGGEETIQRQLLPALEKKWGLV